MQQNIPAFQNSPNVHKVLKKKLFAVYFVSFANHKIKYFNNEKSFDKN